MERIYDDDALGRARVTDTPELEAYYDRLEKLEAGALWKVANKIEPWYPQPQSIPVHWRFAELRPLVLEALSLVTGDDAGRRVVALYNPARRDIAATVGLLYSGLQVMGPGESMTAHRHQAAALRFVLEGTGRVDHRRRPEAEGRSARLRHHAELDVARARQRGRSTVR